MPTAKVRSYMARKETYRPEWYVVDADGRILGRLAARIATILMGKHKPTYTPHVDTGDFVIVTNCEKVRLTGKKWDSITYDRYTYYPGGFRSETAASVLKRHPDRVIREAVRRMLPKTALGRNMLKKLKIYAGPEHPHSAQQPRPWES